MRGLVVAGAIAFAVAVFAAAWVGLSPSGGLGEAPQSAPIGAAAPSTHVEAAADTEPTAVNPALEDKYAPGEKRPRTTAYLATAPRISVDELAKRLASRQKTVLVYVNPSSPDSIPGSVRMDEVDFDDWAKKQAKDAFIVTYCSCPQDRAGASAALRLRELGFSNGFVLEGGIEAWRNAHAAGKDAK